MSNRNICMWFPMYAHVPPPGFPARLSRVGARWLPSEEWRAASLLHLSPGIRRRLITLHHDPLARHTHILPEKPFRFDSPGLDTESVCCIICLQERCRPPPPPPPPPTLSSIFAFNAVCIPEVGCLLVLTYLLSLPTVGRAVGTGGTGFRLPWICMLF